MLQLLKVEHFSCGPSISAVMLNRKTFSRLYSIKHNVTVFISHAPVLLYLLMRYLSYDSRDHYWLPHVAITTEYTALSFFGYYFLLLMDWKSKFFLTCDNQFNCRDKDSTLLMNKTSTTALLLDITNKLVHKST